MTTSPGYDLLDFCGGQKCSKLIDMANKMIERYKDDKTKLYRELNCMEGEFKEKEEYIDHLRKKRSDLEKDVRYLKEKIETKNDDLLKADNDVMEAKFEVVQQEELSKRLEEENKLLRKQKDISDKVIGALKNEVKALKDSLKNFERKSLDANEKEVQTDGLDKEREAFEIEKETLLRNNEDKNEEILLKNKRIEDLENLLNEKSLANSKNSLKDELDVVSCVHCEKCGKFFNSRKELKIHIDTDHKQNVVRSFLQTKLRILEINLSKQRTKLTSSLLKLREKEILDNERCSCIGFCHINHRKHNFYKSKAKDVLDHLAKVQAAETMVDGQTLKNKENTAGIKTGKKPQESKKRIKRKKLNNQNKSQYNVKLVSKS